MILCGFALFCLLAGAFKRLPVYDLFVEGAREGLKTAAGILPSLLVMLGMVKALEESGLWAALCDLAAPVAEKAIPMLQDIMAVHGPDSREALMAGVMMGSSETVFYTCTVYLAAAGVKKSRHTVPCALLACLAGYAGAVLFCP